MDINPSPFTRFKTNKPQIARSVSENRAAAKAAIGKDPASTAADTQQPDLKTGQMIKGQIMDYQPGAVQIRLEPGGQVLRAKLSGDIPLSIGQEAQFLITEVSSEQLVFKIIPDQEVVSANAAVLKALNAAGFAMSERNKAIVTELLNHMMPVDKQTLQTLIQHSHKNREASPLTLVLMHKYQIPMTSSNIRQFEAYQRGSNQLLDKLSTITKELTRQIMAPQNQPDSSGKAYPGSANQISFSEGQLTEAEATNINPLMRSQSDPLSDTIHSPAVLQTEYSPSITSSVLPSTEFVPREELLLISEELIDLLCSNTGDTSNKLAAVLNPEERIALVQRMELLSTPEEVKEQIIHGTLPMKELLSFISTKLSQSDASAAPDLLLFPEYTQLIEKAFLQKWTLTPEKLADKTSVKKLFHTLQEDLVKLDGIISEAKKESCFRLQEPIKNTKEHLQFLQDLNKAFTFLTLPLQLKDQNVQSDFYVFTRKKALSNKKEPLSVLLHLDMNHLGPTNIYIQMYQNQIQSKFYMSDLKAADLLEEYLPTLTEALNKKGYSITAELVRNYEKPDFCKDFIEHSVPDHEVLRYTFDIRT